MDNHVWELIRLKSALRNINLHKFNTLLSNFSSHFKMLKYEISSSNSSIRIYLT